jgi:hypothetical protein
MAGKRGGAKGLGKLCVGSVAGAGAAAVELGGPVGESASVAVAGEGGQTGATALLMQQEPGFGGGLGERVDGLEPGVGDIVGDEGTPQGVLLRGTEEQVGGFALKQQLMPEAGEPCVPGQDGGRLPEGKAARTLAQVEVVQQGAGGALVGGEDVRAMGQSVGDVLGQGGGPIHTPFIRLPVAEKRALPWALAPPVSWRDEDCVEVCRVAGDVVFGAAGLWMQAAGR